MTWLLLVGAACLVGGWSLLWRRSQFERRPAPRRPLEEHVKGSVRGLSFSAKDGTPLDGWLFLPRARNAPVVLMAPGLGGTKDGFLEPFAWAFVERGVGVLAFDYRCFGGSDGMPRHWVDPQRHREDYEAALAFVRDDLSAKGDVDRSRIALWGSSFSAGIALVMAAQNPDVRALVVQCPFLKTPAALHPRGLRLLRFVFWATLDLLRILPPIYVPLFGRPGEWAFATSQENPSVNAFDGPLGSRFWRALPKPGLGGWDNRMLARTLASIAAFVPIDHAKDVTCPVLFVGARSDDMVPLSYVEDAHELAPSPDKEMIVFDSGHFDLYVGDPQAENARRQAAFLAQHLGASADGA